MRAALPVDTVELRAGGQAPAPGSRHRLRRQTLALLVAAALEDEAAGLRLHALAEPMGPCALALLGLVRALHCEGECSPDSFLRISALIARTSVQTARPAPGQLYARPSLRMPDRWTPRTGPINLARRPSDDMGPDARRHARAGHRFHFPRLVGAAETGRQGWGQAVRKCPGARSRLGSRALWGPPAARRRARERRAARDRAGRRGVGGSGPGREPARAHRFAGSEHRPE